jgi:hypothetical protein
MESKEMEIIGSHAANWTCDWLRSYVWEVRAWPFYTPSLMPSDFCPFGPLKKHLSGKGFATDADVKQAVTWQQTTDTDFFCAVIQGLCLTLWGQK